MIHYIIAFVVALVLILLTFIWFIFQNKKKPDENDSLEIKSSLTETRPISSTIKKGKKKGGKKQNANEPELGNNLDENFAESSRGENLISLDTREIYEPEIEKIIPLKNSEEMAVPTKNKRKGKGKNPSGDQLSSETKISEPDKNENQSNTLLGRNNDEKQLQEEIQNLLKKLEDVDNEKKKNESEVVELKSSIHKSEKDNETLKSNLANITAQMTKLKSELDCEKEKSTTILNEKESAKKDLEVKSSQIALDNEGHTAMYKKYESKIEELKGDIKTRQTELSNLNKKLKEELENVAKVDKKFHEVNEILQEKINELKEKDVKCNQFQEMNNALKKAVDDLNQRFSVKENEFLNIRKVMNDQSNKFKVEIDRLEHDNKNKDSEITNLKKNQSVLTEESILLKKHIDGLNHKIVDSEEEFRHKCAELADSNAKSISKIKDLEATLSDKEKEYNSRITEMDENNTRLQVAIHNLEKEMETSRRTISGLEEINTMILENNVADTTAIKITCADKEEEIKKQSMEYQNKLKKVIDEKNIEIGALKLNEVALENAVSTLKIQVDELSMGLSKASNQDEIKELRSNLSKLQHVIEDKECEINDIKKEEQLLKEQLSNIDQLTEELKQIKSQHSDLIIKYDNAASKSTHLESLHYDLDRECKEKTYLAENLQKQNASLLEKLSSIPVELTNAKERIVEKEDVTVCLNADNDTSKKLHEEIETLSRELRKKDDDVKDLLQTQYLLIEDKEALEKELVDQAQDLRKQISELTKEIFMLQENGSQDIVGEEIVAEQSVQLNSVCDRNSIVDKDEVEGLKSHISKLEKELLAMQGRYYVLKEDSIKVNDKHTHSIEKSQTKVISIPPNDSDNCAPVLQENGAKSTTHNSLEEAINRLNSEIEEQRLTNQKLSGHLKTKENEVNVLKQCLLGLDGSLGNIGHMANELQKTCSLTQSEKSSMKSKHDTLIKDHELLTKRYLELEKKWSGLNVAVHEHSAESGHELTEKMTLLEEENQNLRAQLEQYRISLEQTEQMLQKIQFAVDKEESDWASALRSSERECSSLETKVKELTLELEELRSGNATDASNMIASVTSIDNGIVSSESKKKRKRKNKKKKNKNRVASESNGI